MTLRISAFQILFLIALLLINPISSHSSRLRLRRAHARLHRLHDLILQLEAQALHRNEPLIQPTDNTVNTEPFYTPIKNNLGDNWTSNQPIINMNNMGNELLSPVQNGNNNNPFINNWSSPGQAINPNNGLIGDDASAPVANLFGNNWSGLGGQTSPLGSKQLINPIDGTNPLSIATPITDNWTSNSPMETSPILPFAPFNQPDGKRIVLDRNILGQGDQLENPLFNSQGNVNDVPSQPISNDPNSSNIDPLVTESLAAQRTQLGTSDAAQTPSDLALQSAAAQQAQGQLSTVDAGQTPSDLALQSAAAQQAQGQNTNPLTSFISSQPSHEALEQLAEQQVESTGKGYII